MPNEIVVPTLGESIVEATVGHWLKHEGDAVAQGEIVVELETEKVNMEVAAPSAGVLATIVKGEGETVGSGETLAIVGEASATHATVAAADPPATASATPAPPPQAPPAAPDRVTPLARRMAEERGIDPHQVRGTGPGGRITQSDISTYLEGQRAENGTISTPPSTPPSTPVAAQPSARPPVASPTPAAPAPASSAAPVAARPVPAPPRAEERVRLSRRRLTIARRLVEAQRTAAILTTFNEVDMSAIMELRGRRRQAFKERHGVGLGYMSFFTRAVIGALKAYPRLNAELQGDELVIKRYYDIGIAVGLDEGLVVPVLRDADRLTFAEIERRIAALAEKARQNTLTLEELQGGTFTITNGGTFGSLLSTPILNTPQVGILGMHKIEERPIALNGQVVIHPMMYLAVSYDHRIIDGKEAVSFLVRVKELLEDAETLLLEG
ncbi:MAG: 2-oxoglutarate dehydrogenase complex dihydrolipoyllysine-residue succinyltransferase [Ktedonobacterales bacterium]|nr:2-oxoglutarate dehydrogenase complex dihydrolipoyllysine-residue succinyltransferase [Ktedonobacterales bacterium]